MHYVIPNYTKANLKHFFKMKVWKSLKLTLNLFLSYSDQWRSALSQRRTDLTMINFVQAVLVGETNRELFHIDLADRPLEVNIDFFISCFLSASSVQILETAFQEEICKKICSHNETLPPKKHTYKRKRKQKVRRKVATCQSMVQTRSQALFVFAFARLLRAWIKMRLTSKLIKTLNSSF